ncbi:MAG TPA: hypothetical protein VE685_20360 [Thermoanaerobaculia bacterium]|nr:hypothetical protein [Thermoanaerobaculia bacterium]
MTRETESWTRNWEQCRTALFEFLGRIEGGDVEEAGTVLRKVRECRETWIEPPDPELRLLVHRVLDEVWEAARASLYGDLESSRQHTAAAHYLAREVQAILDFRVS